MPHDTTVTALRALLEGRLSTGEAARLAHACDLDGTMTGVHGVGLGRNKYMQAEDGDAWALVAVIKQAIDPSNIINPGRMVNIN